MSTDNVPDTTFELDPRGDITFVVFNVPQSLPCSLKEVHAGLLDGLPVNGEELEIEEKEPDTDNEDKEEMSSKPGSRRSSDQRTRKPIQIRASSKHLMLACPQFERMLKGKFQEGIKLQTTGHLDIPISGWNAIPFLILMMIIHGKTRAVPRKISLERLAEMAGLVDYYECYEVVEVFSDLWIANLEKDIPITLTVGAVRWLCISWVFQRCDIFEAITKIIQLESIGRIRLSKLPIPDAVLGRSMLGWFHVRFDNHFATTDAIDAARAHTISQIIDSFHDLHEELQDGPIQCSLECDCMLLGALTKHMRKLGISPKPQLPFSGQSVKIFLYKCKSLIESPTWYSRKARDPHDCDLQGKVLPILDSLEDSLNGLSIETFTKLRVESNNLEG